jgi:hypothetical protein
MAIPRVLRTGPDPDQISLTFFFPAREDSSDYYGDVFRMDSRMKANKKYNQGNDNVGSGISAGKRTGF